MCHFFLLGVYVEYGVKLSTNSSSNVLDKITLSELDLLWDLFYDDSSYAIS